MRELTDFRVNPANDRLSVKVTDEPGAGGANHVYEVSGFDAPKGAEKLVISFQNGPIADNGVNGVTQEVLLSIVADRLRSFQAGKFACEENGRALAHVEAAQAELLGRTRARMARGVEGTHKV